MPGLHAELLCLFFPSGASQLSLAGERMPLTGEQLYRQLI